MKICLFLAVPALLAAQAPPPSSPDTVVAKVDGKNLTLGELKHMLEIYPPQFLQAFQRDPGRAIQDAFLIKYAAAEGEKLNLGDEEPLKEQLQIQRMNAVAQAMITHERNFFNVTPDDTDKYYRSNQ